MPLMLWFIMNLINFYDQGYSDVVKFFTNSSEENEEVKSNISISNIPETPKVILIIFPIQHDFFRVASYSYRNLPYNKNKIEFHYVINSNFTDSFSLRRGTIYKMELDKKSCNINKNTLLNKLGKINLILLLI